MTQHKPTADNAGWMEGALAEVERHNRRPAPPPTRADQLAPIPWGAIQSLPKREYIVKRLLDRAGLSVLYGESNSGKSFFALDIALAVARGIEWRERRVYQCPVVYIAAEGGLGLVERLDAYELRYEVKPAETPIHLIPVGVDLCGDSDADIIVKAVENITPGLIVAA